MSRSNLSSLRWCTVVAVVAVLAFAGCGQSSSDSPPTGSTEAPQTGGTLKMSQGEEVITLDPLVAIDLPSAIVISQINEPLFMANPKGEVEPWLVSSVKKSAAERVWTLRLREGVRFTNGDPLTSADVVFTLEAARKSTAWEALLSGIKKVEAPSPSVVVITNSSPAPELEGILSQFSFGIVPKGYGGHSEKEFAQHPIGTGPFTLAAWKHGESITLAKNPHYWREGLPYLDRIDLEAVSNSESRVSQLKGGELDAAYGVPWPQVEAIESSPETQFANEALSYTQFLILNSRDPLFQNKQVREAVDLAVDRPGIVDTALGGQGEPAGAWVAPATPYSAAGIIPATKQDLEKAKSLLASAINDGVDPTFTITMQTESSFAGLASQVLESDLREVGFRVTVQSYDIAGVLERYGAGKFDLGILEVYDATPSPAEVFGIYNTTEGVFAGIDVAETTELAEQAQSETDPTKREHIWLEMQELLNEQKYILPISYSPQPWAYRTNVKGFEIGLNGVPTLSKAGFAK